METLTGWLDEWDLTLRTGTVDAESRTVYLRSVRQFLDHLAAHHPEVTEPLMITRKTGDRHDRLLNHSFG